MTRDGRKQPKVAQSVTPDTSPDAMWATVFTSQYNEEGRLRAALRRERLLGRSGHRAYSLTRHRALLRRLNAMLKAPGAPLPVHG